MKNNVILIGMPGAGKSTAGVILAKLLGYGFMDTDLVIQNSEGRLLRQIIADEGVEGFISLENRIVSGIDAENTVIATGGSVVYGAEAMENLSSLGKIVYLELGYDELSRRLDNIQRRGVVLKDGQDLRDIYAERLPLYKKYADVTIDEKDCGVEATVSKIIEKLN